jgi:hypothetical protein
MQKMKVKKRQLIPPWPLIKFFHPEQLTESLLSFILAMKRM